MFITWGLKTVSRDLGPDGRKHCPTCECQRGFYKHLLYRVHHVMWVFRWPTGVRYASRCDQCGHGEPLDAEQVRAELGKSPVAWIDRYGWLLGIASVFAFFFIAGVLDPHPPVR
jgi:hypothetical protein